MQKVDKHSRNSFKRFSMKSSTFSCLICALILYFAQEIAQKGKTCSRLLKPLKVAQKLPSTIGTGLQVSLKVIPLK